VIARRQGRRPALPCACSRFLRGASERNTGRLTGRGSLYSAEYIVADCERCAQPPGLAIDSLNQCFRERVAVTARGGRRGGAAARRKAAPIVRLED
jgi:hypothetical protein